MQSDGSNGSQCGPADAPQAARFRTRGVTGEPPLFLPSFFLALTKRPRRPSTEQVPIAVLPEADSGRLIFFLPALAFFAFVNRTAPPLWMPSTATFFPLPPLTRTLIAPASRIACCWSLMTVTLPPFAFCFLPLAAPTSRPAQSNVTPAIAKAVHRVSDSVRLKGPSPWSISAHSRRALRRPRYLTTEKLPSSRRSCGIVGIAAAPTG